MGKRPKRKVVLFLVEGKSDREALQLAIPELYDKIDDTLEVFFPIIRDEDSAERGGDITSSSYIDQKGIRKWIHPNNIEDAIYMSFLADFFDDKKILPKDVSEIIQIVDTDGAYIDDEDISEDASLPKEESPLYTDNGIVCVNKERIIHRNKQKRDNLDYLSSCSSIKVRQKTVPYSVYYFSCNLDHFLHNSANLDYRMKRQLADIFARNYIDNAEGFVNQISSDHGAVKSMSYEESWNYIKADNHSLHRHTNINLLLSSLLKRINEE